MAVTTSSGNGFALYNGVKLPDINTVWTDKETYPYASICVMNLELMGISGNVYVLYLVSEIPVVFGEYLEASGNVPWITYMVSDTDEAESLAPGISTSSWRLESEGEFSGNAIFDRVVWASHNTLNEDGSIHITASKPISLDGMNIIEWDGDTTGLRNLADVGIANQYIVSADSIDLSSADGCIFVAQVADTGARVGFFGDDLEFYRETMGEEWMWTLSVTSTVVAGSYNVPSLSVVGTSFYSDAAQHTALFAYPASGGGEPTYDRTAFLSGMAMGLCGKGYPAGTNGHMSYNGIELADINSIWTDKSNHVFICKADNSYFAIVSTVTPYQDTVNGGISLSAPFYFKQYGCFTDEATANQYGTTAYTWTLYQDHSLDEGVSNFDQTVIWTSTDIRKDSDGSIFLAASEPFPAGGIGGNDDFTKGYLVGAELRRKRVIPT